MSRLVSPGKEMLIFRQYWRMRVSPTHLVHVPPVLAVVIEPLPHHAHDFGEGHDIVRQIGYLWHQGAAGAPWVIGRGFSNLKRRRNSMTFNAANAGSICVAFEVASLCAFASMQTIMKMSGQRQINGGLTWLWEFMRYIMRKDCFKQILDYGKTFVLLLLRVGGGGWHEKSWW